LLILVTNDDGIYAPGLKALSLALTSIGRVAVVAPERERSAVGHGITMHKPLRVTEVPWPDPIGKAMAINGNPADCVKLALEALLDEKPVLVVSGINRGENVGTYVFYSGTVSGAIEGCINGLPSLAVSLAGEEEPLDYSFAARFTALLAREVVEKGLPSGVFLNINVPHLPPEQIKGVRATRLGRRRYIDTISCRKDPRGRDYYWLAGKKDDYDHNPETDVGALNAGMITITPLHLDLTHYPFLEQLPSYLTFFKPGPQEPQAPGG